MSYELRKVLIEIAKARPANEAEVETKILLHLFNLLNYTDLDRADKPGIAMKFGRERSIKYPDYILYDGEERSLNNALITVEAKNIKESLIGAEEQVRSYVTWAGTPFYIACNGEFILIAQFIPGDSTIKRSIYPIKNLYDNWENINNLIGKAEARLSKERIGYINTYLPEVEKLPAAEFFKEYLQRLQLRFENIEYTKEALKPPEKNQNIQPMIPVKVMLDNSTNKVAVNEVYFSEILLGIEQNFLIIGLPGSGKTTLCKRITRELTKLIQKTKSNVLPIYLSLRNELPNTVLSALKDVCAELGIRVFANLYKKSLENTRIALIMDGLDEVMDIKKFAKNFDSLVNSCNEVNTFIVSRPGIDEIVADIVGFGNSENGKICNLTDDDLDQILRTYLKDISQKSLLLNLSKNKKIPELGFPMNTLMAIKIANENPNWAEMNTAKLYLEYLNVLHLYFNSVTVRGTATTVNFDSLLEVYSKAAILIRTARNNANFYSLPGLFERLEEYFDQTIIISFFNLGIITTYHDHSEFIHLSFEDFGVAYGMINALRNNLEQFASIKPSENIYKFANYLANIEDERILVDLLSNDNIKLRKRSMGILKHGCCKESIEVIWDRIIIENSIKVWSKMNYILLTSGFVPYLEWIFNNYKGIPRNKWNRIAIIARRFGNFELFPYVLKYGAKRKTPEMITAIFELALKFENSGSLETLVEFFNERNNSTKIALTNIIGRYRDHSIARKFIRRQLLKERSLRVIIMFIGISPELLNNLNSEEINLLLKKLANYGRLKKVYQKKIVKICDKLLYLDLDNEIRNSILKIRDEIICLNEY